MRWYYSHPHIVNSTAILFTQSVQIYCSFSAEVVLFTLTDCEQYVDCVFGILALSAVILLPLLLPVAATDKSLKLSNNSTSNGTFNDLDRLAMGNVQAKSSRLWAFAISTYWVSFVAYFFLWKGYKHASSLRAEALMSPDVKVEQFAILVRDIPVVAEHQSTKKIALHAERIVNLRRLCERTAYRPSIHADCMNSTANSCGLCEQYRHLRTVHKSVRIGDTVHIIRADCCFLLLPTACAIAWVSLAALLVHIEVSWLFVYKLQMEVVGAATTLNVSWWVLVFGLLDYTVSGGCPLTWTGFSTEAFSGL